MSTNDPMTQHNTTVTASGTWATCTCGWYSRWATADGSADGSAYEDAAVHNRRHTGEEA